MSDQDSEHENGDEPTYEVGYKKPPKSGQFPPGHKLSKGRRKGSKNIRTIIGEVFYEKIGFTLKGKKAKAPAIEVILRQLQSKALGGDQKAILSAVSIVLGNEPAEEAPPPPELSEAEKRVMANWIEMASLFKTGASDA